MKALAIELVPVAERRHDLPARTTSAALLRGGRDPASWTFADSRKLCVEFRVVLCDKIWIPSLVELE